MKSLTTTIQTWLKDSTGVDINVDIGYNNNKARKFPLIVITEIENKSVNQIKGVEYASKLAYQIDIYAPTMKFKDEIVNGRNIVEQIGADVDTLLTSKWFTRGVSPLGNIANIDPTISRYTLRYSVGITKDDVIFRI